MKLPRTIVLGGGGVKAIAHIGALQELNDLGLLQLVRKYVGLSAGSLVAFGMVLGYTIAALKDICERFDFAVLQEPAPDGFLSFIDNYGIDTGEKLVSFLKALLTIKGFPADLTFKGLKDTSPTHKELAVVASNLSTGQPVVFSYENTPNCRLIDALRSSMSLPFYFWPVHLDDGLHVDGGVHGLYPMNLLTAEEQEYALGIILLQDIDVWNKFDGPDSYILRLYEITSHSKSTLLYDRYKDNTICIKTPPISSIKFGLSVDERKQLYKAGSQAVKDFLQFHKKSNLIRRASF
jgi:predicted acylesterase/phospholipase RssA